MHAAIDEKSATIAKEIYEKERIMYTADSQDCRLSYLIIRFMVSSVQWLRVLDAPIAKKY
jgi:hypothetical protein